MDTLQVCQPRAPIKVAVVGCGAVSENFHLPVLAGHDGVAVTCLVDPNLQRAQRLASLYGVPQVSPSADVLDRQIAEAALIATPPFLHTTGAIDLMRRGLHVLVEKPMALTHADGERMVAVGQEHGVVLSVGLFRRLVPAIRLLRAMVDAGEIGNVLKVDAEVGSAYTWQLTTLAGMHRAHAGGGILVDMGSHVLDLLMYICNGIPTLAEYADNASTGVETDCRIELRLRRGPALIPVHVELSRTRTLRNSIRVEGSNGSLEWMFGERSRLQVHTGFTCIDTVRATPRATLLEARWGDEVEQPGYEGFRSQIDDWVGAIAGGSSPVLSGESVLPTVKLIEECYARRVPVVEPWFAAALPRAAETDAPDTERRGRVLVTGASGFIGCRLSERLHFGSDWRVRALIRSAGRAVRLARMPIEFAIGDLASSADLAKALEGCEAVVHGGIGTSWRRSERVAINVSGTRNLVDAALRAGVKRFVHLSTIAVYGDPASGVISEESPVSPKKGWDYAESKYAAEQIVLEAVSRGLPAVVLRVAVVYGPHNMTIVARPLQHLAHNRLFLVDCRQTPSNTIYIDNLCHGIQLALDAPSHVDGEVFLLSDDDGFTWGDYFEYFAERMGARVNHVPKSETAAVRSGVGPPLKRWYSTTRDLITSAETKALAKRIYTSDPWGTPARWLIETFPGPAGRLKRLVRPEEAFVYRPRPDTGDELAPFTVDPITARVSTDKAKRVLGFDAVVPRTGGMELTLEWARYARIVPRSAHAEMAAAL